MPMQAIYKILIVQETANLTYIDSDEKETIKYFEPQFKNNTYLQKDREPLNAFFPPSLAFQDKVSCSFGTCPGTCSCRPS